jgi:cytoskeletal protein RodZ
MSSENSIGAVLKAARLEAKLSLQDVATAMRVRSRIIEDLEADRYQSSGGLTYARGHIKTLARIYGISVDHLINNLDALESSSNVSMSELLEENNVTTSVEKVKPSWKLFGIAAGITTFAIFGYQILPGLFSFESAKEQSVQVINEKILRNDPEPPAVASASAGVSLQLSANDGLSWVKVEGADGATKFEGKLRTGQIQDFYDDQLIRVVVGNAGVISITYNGEDLGRAGRVGEVVRLQFTPDSNSAG